MEKEYVLSEGARRMAEVKPSMIRAIMNRASELQAEGRDVIRFSAGEPDFDTPSDIKEATIRAITNNLTHYSSNKGDPLLRKKISAYVKWETGRDYDPETEILVTSSAAEALNNAVLAFVDRDDEVIILEPAFVSYNCLAGECEAKVVKVPLDPAKGFQVDLDALRAAVSRKTKLLMLNNPSNPTGCVLSRECLLEIARLSKEYNFLVIADEIYSRLVYDDAEFCSMASIPGMKERAVIVSGFSKTYAMTGWRLGYIAADAKLLSLILRVHQYSTTCSPTFIQRGVAEGMDTPRTKKDITDMVAAFDRRRNMVMTAIDGIPGLHYVRPRGAFYMMVDVSGLGIGGYDFAMRLLEEKYVATVPAVGLGEESDTFIRLAYTTSDDRIAEGLERMKEFCAGLASAK